MRGIKIVRVVDEKTGEKISSSESGIKAVRVVDEKTGDPLKKKESTQLEVSTSGSQNTTQDVPSVAPNLESGSTRNPNPLLQDNLQRTANELMPRGLIEKQIGAPYIKNTQGDVISSKKNAYGQIVSPSIPKKSQAQPSQIGTNDSNRSFYNERLNDVQSAMNNELSFAKTDAQKKEIESRYSDDISSLSGQAKSYEIAKSPIIPQESKKELVKPENVNSTLIPKKKPIPTLGIGQDMDPTQPSQVEIIDNTLHNIYVDKLTEIDDIDEESLKSDANFTPDQVNDILKYKENAFKVNSANLPTSKKLEIVSSNQKKLEKNIESKAYDAERINNAATENRNISDLTYEYVKSEKDNEIKIMLNQDMSVAVSEHADNLYELRDVMAFLTDRNLSAEDSKGGKRTGPPPVSIGENGEVIVNGFNNSTEAKFYQDKLSNLLKKVEESKSKLYQIQQDKIDKKERERFELSKNIKVSEAYLSKFEKGTPEYNQALEQIQKDKGTLKQYDYNIEKLKTEGNIVFKTNPDQVAKSLISEGTDDLRLSFSKMPGNLTPKQQFDLGFENLARIVKQQEQELGADNVLKIAQMILKDRIGQLSKEEIEYYKNKKALASMVPMHLINETGITNQSDNFMGTLMAGFARWTMPNTSGGETQTKLLQKALQSSYDVGAKTNSFNELNIDEIEKRAKGPEEFWNQEVIAEIAAPTVSIMADMATGGAILKLAKIGEAGAFADELYSIYDSAMKSTKLGRFFLPIVDNAVMAEATGQMLKNSASELNLENIFFGGVAAKVLGTFITSIPAPQRVGVISTLLGSKAATYIGAKIADSAGEVVGEFTEELTAIYYDELRERGFWDEVESRFGDFDENMRFIATTALMGLVTNGGVNDKAKEQYDKLPADKKVQVDEVLAESFQDVNAVNHDLNETAKEEVKREEAVNAIDNETKTEEPIAPEVVTNEAKAEEEVISKPETTETGKKEIPEENKMTVYHGGTLDAGGDNILYTSPDKVQSEYYAKNNDGFLTSFEIDKTKVASEEVLLETMNELGLKSPSDIPSDEIAVYELIDQRFEDTALSEEEVQSLFEALKAKGYESAMFRDEDVTLTNKMGIDNIVIFDKQSLNEKSVESDQKNADNLFDQGYKPVINGKVKTNATQEDIDNHFDDNMTIEMVKPKTEITNQDGNATTETNKQEVPSDTKNISTPKKAKVKGARKDSRAKQAFNVEHSNARGAALKYFIGGGKINSSALEELFGRRETPGQQAKKATGEKRAKIGLLNNSKGRTVDDIANQLWEDNQDTLPSLTTQDYKDEIESILSDYNGTSGMIDEMLSMDSNSAESIQAEADYYESQYGPESAGNEDLIAESEDFFDSLTEEEKQAYVDDFENAQSEFESQFKNYESSQVDTNTNVKEKTGIEKAIKYLNDLESDLLSGTTFNSGLGQEAALLAIRTAREVLTATNNVTQAIKEAIDAFQSSQWYRDLSEEQKAVNDEKIASIINEDKLQPKPEKTEPSPREKTSEEKVSKQADRAAKMQDSETGKRLRELSRYKVQNQEEHLGIAKEVVKLVGGNREAIQFVNNIDNKVNPEIKEAVMLYASAEMGTKAMSDKVKALQSGSEEDLMQAESDLEEALMYVRDISIEGTKMGQRNAFKNKIYEQFPSFYSLSNKDKFTKKFGASDTEQEDINDLQDSVKQGVADIIDEEFSSDEVIDELKAKIEELEARLKEGKTTSTTAKKQQKYDKAEEDFKSALSEFKKAGKSGQVSASIIPLNSGQIEAIGKMVKALVNMGITKSDLIVSKIYNSIKDSDDKIRRDHIRTIAREIEEFESLHKTDSQKKEDSKIEKLKDKLVKAQKGELEKQIREKDSAEVKSLKDDINKIQRKQDLEKKLSDLKAGKEDVDLTDRREDSDEVKALKKQIRDEQELSPKVLRDLMKQHFTGKNPSYRTLAESIAQKTGKSVQEVQDLADLLEERIKTKVQKMIEAEHKKFVEKSKSETSTSIKDLREKRLKGIASVEELKLLDQKLEDSKSRKEVNQIMKILRMGGLANSSDFTKAFEKRFGFGQLSSTTQKQVDALALEIFDLQNEAIQEVQTTDGKTKQLNTLQRQRIGMLQKKLNTLLESNKPWNTARILKEIVSVLYIHILSGPVTLVRAFIGGYGSGLIGTFAYVARNINNIGALKNGLTAMMEAIPTAYNRAVQSRKTGYDVFKDSSIKGETASDRMGWYEKTVLSGLDDAVRGKKPLPILYKSIGQAGKVIHALGALDAFMNTISGSFVGTVEATKKGQFDKIMDADLEKIASNDWNDFKNSMSELAKQLYPGVSGEKLDYETKRLIRKEMGLVGSRMNPKSVFTKARKQELKENNLGEFFETAVGLAKDASMMGQPDGVFGLASKGLQGISTIKDDDKAFNAIMKFIPNLVFKFTRITGQVGNKSFNNIPLIGIVNAAIGVGYNYKTGELEYDKWNSRYRSNPDLFKQRATTNLIVTIATTALFLSMFERDDEGKWQLKEDRPIDLRGFGNTSQGGKAKNERINENYRNLSVSFRDKDGKFSKYTELKLLPELAGIAASLGYFADIMKGDTPLSGDKDVQRARLEEFKGGMTSIGNVFSALAQNTKLLTESSFSSIAGIKRDYNQGEDLVSGMAYVARGIAMNNTKPLIEPRVFESVITAVASANEVKEKDLKDWQYFAKNLYGLDSFFEDNKTDVFGNEYTKENDYEKFLKETFGAGEKRSDQFKNVALLYKFDEGANVSKIRFDELKPSSKSPFVVDSRRYLATDPKIQAEAQDIQEKAFNELVNNNYELLNALPDKESLEKRLKLYQKFSIQNAKRQIVLKYIDSEKIMKISN